METSWLNSREGILGNYFKLKCKAYSLHKENMQSNHVHIVSNLTGRPFNSYLKWLET